MMLLECNEKKKEKKREIMMIDFTKDENGKYQFDFLNYKFEKQWFAGSGCYSEFQSEILKTQVSFLGVMQFAGQPKDKEYIEFVINNLVMFFLGKDYEVTGEIVSSGEIGMYATNGVDDLLSKLSGMQQIGGMGYHKETDKEDADNAFKEMKKHVSMMVRRLANRSLKIEKVSERHHDEDDSEE